MIIIGAILIFSLILHFIYQADKDVCDVNMKIDVGLLYFHLLIVGILLSSLE